MRFILFAMLASSLSLGLKAETEFERTKRLAVGGDKGAQYKLGEIYDFGQGLEQNYKEALKWYRMAAEQGLVEAQYNLGTVYLQGNEVPQDHKEAVKWFRMAADQGYADAQYNLGALYAMGKGVDKDFIAGYAWTNVAKANGYDVENNLRLFKTEMTSEQIAEALTLADDIMKRTWDPANVESSITPGLQLSLVSTSNKGGRIPQTPASMPSKESSVETREQAKKHYFGRDSLIDYRKSFALFKQSAQAGDAEAARYLGIMYLRGKGVLKDNAKALEWFNIAAARGDNFTGKKIQMLKTLLGK